MRNKIKKFLTMLFVSMIMIAVASAQLFSPATITQTGTNTVHWSGQGSTSIDQGTACTTGAVEVGLAPNTPYLLWVFNSDGLTLNPNQGTLNLGGTGTGTFTMSAPNTNSANHKAVTGFFVPNGGLTASATFNVQSLGQGSNEAILTISHGCSGGTQIPEFPTVALPIAAVIGLVFFFQHRKKK